MTLYLIRHGKTATSGRTFAGRSDVPLNAAGRHMARNVMRQLAERPIERIIASPLSRALHTARPLADRLGLQVEQDARLSEFDFGDYEGRAKIELGLNLRKTHAHTPVPGGEALIDLWRRAGDFVDALPWTQGHIAIVGHFWVNRMIFGHVSRMSFDAACRCREYRPKTGSIIQLPLGDPHRPESSAQPLTDQVATKAPDFVPSSTSFHRHCE